MSSKHGGISRVKHGRGAKETKLIFGTAQLAVSKQKGAQLNITFDI